MVIDTDVVIRFLTRDDSQKAQRFERFLESGKKGIITDVTFAEIYWTLNSFYKFPKHKILNILEALISYKSISSNKEVLMYVIKILREQTISFIDAYTIAYAAIKNDAKILSFDKGFDKIKEIKRLEP